MRNRQISKSRDGWVSALDALNKERPARASDELLEAVALAPGYAPANVYLAQAWKNLGYDAKALGGRAASGGKQR